MATTADIKNGMCLDIDGQYYFITEFLHVKPGKGPAFVRTKLKNVVTGRTLDRTFNAGVRIEDVVLVTPDGGEVLYTMAKTLLHTGEA